MKRIRPLSGSCPLLLRRLARSARGAVAAEFALVLPILIVMFFGMIEYGFIYFTYGSMQAAARDVARQVAVNTLAPGDTGTEVRNRLPDWAKSAATVTATASDPGNPATNVYRIDIEVPISNATPVPLFTLAQSSSIHTHVEMKQELPFVELTP